MAAIDKIYGSPKEWKELRDFLLKNKPEYLRFMYSKPCCTYHGDDHNDDHNDRLSDLYDFPLSNFSEEADVYLINHCPLKFITAAIKDQYSEEWYKKNKDTLFTCNSCQK